jgi:hypothetical protein
MRGLARNKQTIWFAQYVGEGENKDSDSLYTGETIPVYSDPYPIRANVSAARGTSDIELFGVNTNYTKTVVVDDTICPIDEHSRLWIDRDPRLGASHNYEVVMVAKSLNHITYAVKQVDFA